MKVAPPPSPLRQVSSPPCSSMICRVMDRPSPVPCGLVVKNGSNSRPATSAVIPPPVSETNDLPRASPSAAAPDRDRAPARERLHPVLHEIEHRLAQERPIDLHHRRRRVGGHVDRQPLAGGDRTHEGRQLLQEVVDRLLLEVRLGKAREGQVLLGQRVERVHLIADGRDQPAGLVHVASRVHLARCPAAARRSARWPRSGCAPRAPPGATAARRWPSAPPPAAPAGSPAAG